MMAVRKIVVRAQWDREAHWWVATSEDVPGLATGAATFEELLGKLDVMIPEMIELNDPGMLDEAGGEGTVVSYSVMAEASGETRLRRSA